MHREQPDRRPAPVAHRDVGTPAQRPPRIGHEVERHQVRVARDSQATAPGEAGALGVGLGGEVEMDLQMIEPKKLENEIGLPSTECSLPTTP